MLARFEEHRVIETDIVFLVHFLEVMFDDDELLLIAHEWERLDQERVNGRKIVLASPIPSASVKIAIVAKPGDLANVRAAYLRSRIIAPFLRLSS